MIPIDQIRDAAVGYLEGHAVELGQYLVRAVALWIRNRRHAERVIREAHDAYVREFDAIEAHMKGGGDGGQAP